MVRVASVVALLVACSAVSAQQPTAARRGQARTPVKTQQQQPPVKDTFYPADPDAEIETVRERFENGEVHIEREVTLDTEGNYIRHGAWTEWNQSGAEIAKGTYKDDRRHGEWVRMFAGNESELFQEPVFKQFTAPFASRGQFEDGELDGVWTIHDSEGRLVTSWEFQQGRRHGTWTWSYPSGKLMRQIHYIDGLIDGGLLVWDESGELVIEHKYQNGRRLAAKREQYKSGAQKSEGMYLFAKKVMEENDDWWTAKPGKYTTVGSDDRHGPWVTWHENGQVECRGTYQYGLRTDTITWWYPNGQKRLTGGYEAGKPIGAWVWWHENGQKATLGHYEAGEPSGNWVYWNETGRLVQRSDLSLASTVTPQPVKSQQPSPQKSTRRPATAR